MHKSIFAIVLLGVLLGCCQAHMTIWTPTMWGVEQNPTTAWMAQPLQNYNYSNWWMHGEYTLTLPPAAGQVSTLYAGGIIDFEITGNKWSTTLGKAQGGPGLCSPNAGQSPRLPPVPWDNGMNDRCNANIHAPTRADVSACALGIAYKNDIKKVMPNDFVIFSVAHDCIARTLQTFDIPALPACPAGGCVCSWFWIHNSIGGTDQMYMTPFRCDVSNPSNFRIGTPVPPVRCDGKPGYKNGPVTTVCNKVQQPMYWANSENQNMFNPVNTQSAPNYTDIYGFPDGAQNQIFTNAPVVQSSVGDTLLSSGLNTISSAPYSILVTPSLNAGSRLSIQGDGNLVFYDMVSGNAIWSSNTAGVSGSAPYRLMLQSTGNLVIVDSRNVQYWASNTANKGVAPYKLKVRDPHSLTIVDSNGTLIWTA